MTKVHVLGDENLKQNKYGKYQLNETYIIEIS